ncbi:MAG: hypothetical protein R6U22_04835 [Desulfohalobiaceae bacterium]
MQDVIWPAGLQDCLLPEQSFTEAYLGLQDLERAYLKQCIAQIFAWYGASTALQQEQRLHWEQGFTSLSRSRPWPWVLILVQPGMRAPAPLLAAALPALLAQSKEVIVLQSAEQASWTPAQLCGLELAGLELVGAAASTLQQELLQGLQEQNGPGLVLELGHGQKGLGFSYSLGSRGQYLALSVPLQAGIWQDSTVQWDLQALRTAHPDLELESCRPRVESGPGPGEAPETSGAEGFLQKGWELLFLPDSMQGQALEHARLVLGPGQEACWIWPGLEACLFQSRALALGSS